MKRRRKKNRRGNNFSKKKRISLPVRVDKTPRTQTRLDGDAKLERARLPGERERLVSTRARGSESSLAVNKRRDSFFLLLGKKIERGPFRILKTARERRFIIDRFFFGEERKARFRANYLSRAVPLLFSRRCFARYESSIDARS
jgi:hypothetical protein